MYICVYTHRNETRNDSLFFFMKPFSVSVSQDPYRENDPYIFGVLKGINIEKKQQNTETQPNNFLERKQKNHKLKTRCHSTPFRGFWWILVSLMLGQKSQKNLPSKIQLQRASIVDSRGTITYPPFKGP